MITPASRLPSAHSASSTPVKPLAPCSSENATVVTSAEPKSAPSARATTASGATTRHGMRGRSATVVERACGGGWVARWAARNSVPPTPVATATVRPATGCQVVASTVTRIGPSMKTASSTTDSRA